MSFSRNLKSPSYAFSSSDKSLVVENSKKSITILNSRGEIVDTIKGGSRAEDSFYYADSAVINNSGEIYVLEYEYSDVGLKVQRERILRYSESGKFQDVLFEQAYSNVADMPVQNGNITSLQYNNKTLSFLLRTSNNEIQVYKVRNYTPILSTTVRIPSDVIVQDLSYDVLSDVVYAATKSGEIYSMSNDSVDKVLNIIGKPWALCSNGSGMVYYSDIANRQVVCANNSSVLVPTSKLSIGSSIYCRVNASDTNHVAVADGVKLMLLDQSGNFAFNSDKVECSMIYIVARMFIWICLCVTVVLGLVVIVYLLSTLFRMGSRRLSSRVLLLTCIGVVVSVLVAFNVVNSANERLSMKTGGRVEHIARAISEASIVANGDLLETIKSVDDLKSSESQTLEDSFKIYIDTSYADKTNLYYILFKAEDHLVYGILDSNKVADSFSAYQEFENSDFEKISQIREVLSFSKSDTYGTWAYSVAPIYNSQQDLVGYLEIGMDLYNEELQFQTFLESVITAILVVVFLMILLMNEVGYMVTFVGEYRSASMLNRQRNVLSYVRPLAFLAFLVDGVGTTFLPMLSSNLVERQGFNFASELGSALPVAIKYLALALAYVIGNKLLHRLKEYRMLRVGWLLGALSCFAIGASLNFSTYWGLVAGCGLAGLSTGLILSSLRDITHHAATWTEREELQSHINYGSIAGFALGAPLGAYAASYMGYLMLYLCIAIMCAVVVLILISFVNNCPEEVLTTGRASKGLLRKFLFKPEVFSMLVLSVFPVYLVSTFKEFFFPLYAYSTGATYVDIGNIFLLCGVIIVYMVPGILQFMLDTFGARISMALSGLSIVLSLFMYSFMPSYYMSVFTVSLICIFSSVLFSSVGECFKTMACVEDFSEHRASVLSESFSNFGKAVGPAVYGLLLIYDYSAATFFIACGLTFVLSISIVTQVVVTERRKNRA